MGNKKFEGKVLLELGTSVASKELIEYAQSEGAYVIATDYLSVDNSVAKQIANEYANISTVDVDNITEFAKKKNVDGIFCGVSEVNLQTVQAVAEKLDLNCYFNKKQWDICQDKANFKKLCLEHNVLVSQEYKFKGKPTEEEANRLAYPVIVKPVDQGAAVGIHICNNAVEFLTAYSDAYEKSYSHKVIVEDYIVGDEISAAYVIINGEYKLSTIGDKYLNRDQTDFLPLPEAYVYPSKYLDLYLNKCNEQVISMFKSIGLKNGTVFVQGIVKDEQIYIFEAGLRMGGTALFRFIHRINGTNILHQLVNYAMLGSMDGDINKEDARMKGKHCCILSLLNKGGKIAKIKGVEEASSLHDVAETIVRYAEGETVLRSGTLKQSHIRFFIISDSMDEMAFTIKKIQEFVSVEDEQGKNMLMSKFDTDKLFD